MAFFSADDKFIHKLLRVIAALAIIIIWGPIIIFMFISIFLNIIDVFKMVVEGKVFLIGKDIMLLALFAMATYNVLWSQIAGKLMVGIPMLRPTILYSFAAVFGTTLMAHACFLVARDGGGRWEIFFTAVGVFLIWRIALSVFFWKWSLAGFVLDQNGVPLSKTV